MLKVFMAALLIFSISACSNPGTSSNEKQVDSLQKQLSASYKPGFGEFMSGIQVHHAKLWFAGEAENWRLADFEIHEIREAIEGIKTYCSDRKETALLDQYILTPLDSVDTAIRMKRWDVFKKSFLTLTNACNDCHKESDFEFNVITLPSTPPFSNQTFRVNSANKK